MLQREPFASRIRCHVLAFGGQGAREPVQSFVQAISSGGTCGLNEPLTMPQVVEPKFFGDLSCSHGLRQVLLVGKDQQHGITHFIFVQHLGEFLSCVLDTIAVVAVNNVDQSIGTLIVMAPERPDLVLASHVPHGKGQVLVLHCLDVETDGWDCSDDLTQLQLVQNGGLTRSVQTDHQNPHLLLSNQPLPYLGKGET
eukprot:s1291_g14.t1